MSHLSTTSNWIRYGAADGPVRVAQYVGRQMIRRFATMSSILAILWACLMLGCQPKSWTPAVRWTFGRQLLFTGVDAAWVAVRVGAVVGVLLIVQAALWIDALGVTTDVILPMLWRAIVRELAPLLACLLVIGRSGIAMSTELAMMLVNGEIEVWDAQGIDPMTSLVMPRIFSMIISVFCLAILIAVSMVVTGYAIGWMVGAIRVPWTNFLAAIIREYTSLDLVFFAAKTVLAAAFAGTICCIDGLSIRGSATDVPRVASRSGVRGLTAVFVVSAVLSVLIYGRFLVFQIG